MREVAPDIQTWSVHSERKGYDFNGFAVSTAMGTVLIDPPDPGPDGWQTIDFMEPFLGVYVTNRNHSRAAATCRERYGLAVHAHEADAEALDVRPDVTVRGGERIADELEIVHVPGKSPGEIAFWVPNSGAMIVGDVVIGVPPGELSTYPDEVVEDRDELMRSARRLLEYDFDALLLCDGGCLPDGGRAKLEAFVTSA